MTFLDISALRMYLMPCKKLRAEHLVQSLRSLRSPQISELATRVARLRYRPLSRAAHELDAGLRSSRPLVAFDPRCRATHRCAAWNARGTENPSAFVRDCGGNDLDTPRDICFWNAETTRGGEFSLRRGVWTAEDRVDRDRGGLFVRHFGGHRAV